MKYSTNGGFSGLQKELMNSLDKKVEGAKEEIAERVSSKLKDIEINGDMDIKINTNKTKISLGNNVREQIKEQIGNQIPKEIDAEVQINYKPKKIEEIDLNKYIKMNPGDLKKKIQSAYKLAANDNRSAQKEFLAAIKTANRRGINIDDVFTENMGYDFDYYKSEMSSFVKSINTELNKVTFSPINPFEEIIKESQKVGSIEKFLNGIADGSIKASDKVKDLLSSVKILSNGKYNFSALEAGNKHSDGIVSKQYTIIGRQLEDAKGNSTHVEDKVNSLIPKLNAAENEGVKVGTIIGVVKDDVHNLLYEIQKTQKGKIINDENLDFLEATDKELLKLKKDLEILQKNDLYVDFGGGLENILYEKGKGFSFIDLATPKKGAKPGDYLGNSVGDITDWLSDAFGFPKDKVDDFNKRLHSVTEESVNSIKRVPEATSSISKEMKAVADETETQVKRIKENIEEYNGLISKMKAPAFHVGNMEENPNHIADHLNSNVNQENIGSGSFWSFDIDDALDMFNEFLAQGKNVKLYITDLGHVLGDMVNIDSNADYESYVKFLGTFNNYIMALATEGEESKKYLSKIPEIANSENINKLNVLYESQKEFFDQFGITEQKLNDIVKTAVKYTQDNLGTENIVDNLSTYLQSKWFNKKGVSTKNVAGLDNYNVGSVVFHNKDLGDIFSIDNEDDLASDVLKKIFRNAILEKAKNVKLEPDYFNDMLKQYDNSPILKKIFSPSELSGVLLEANAVFQKSISKMEEDANVGQEFQEFGKQATTATNQAKQGLAEMREEAEKTEDNINAETEALAKEEQQAKETAEAKKQAAKAGSESKTFLSRNKAVEQIQKELGLAKKSEAEKIFDEQGFEKVGNRYKVEQSAIDELISARKKLATTTEESASETVSDTEKTQEDAKAQHELAVAINEVGKARSNNPPNDGGNGDNGGGGNNLPSGGNNNPQHHVKKQRYTGTINPDGSRNPRTEQYEYEDEFGQRVRKTLTYNNNGTVTESINILTDYEKVVKRVSDATVEFQIAQHKLNEEQSKQNVDYRVVADLNEQLQIATRRYGEATTAAGQYIQAVEHYRNEWGEGSKFTAQDFLTDVNNQVSERMAKENYKNNKALNNQFEQRRTKLSSRIDDIEFEIDNGNHTQDFINRLNQLRTEMQAIASMQATFIQQSDIDRADQLLEDFRIMSKSQKLSANRQANENSVSKNLGKINKLLSENTRFSFRNTQVFTDLQTLQKEFQNFDTSRPQKELDELNTRLLKTMADFDGLADSIKGKNIFQQIGEHVRSTVSQLAAQYLSFQDIVRYARTAATTLVDLDTQLVDLRKTTSMTSTELNQFYNSSSDIAKQLGVTTSEIISQAAAWSRLGYSTKEAATEMSKLSSQFASISPGMDTESSTDYLVSTMQAFGISVDEVQRKIMDNVNAIGNSMATSNSEIGEMLARSSAAMKAANNSLEETIALESAAVEVTRNAETTGTAFRTISMRIRGYDEETEELSEDLENISGDIADLTKIAGKGGISIFTDETRKTYKSTYQILKDISAIWDDLTDKQQAGLLEKLGGKRGAQSIASILADFSSVEKAMNIMSESAGSSEREMDIIRDSLEFKLNSLRETWVGTLSEIADRGVVGGFLDSLNSISEGVSGVIEKIGILPTTAGVLGTMFGAQNLGLASVQQGKLAFGKQGILGVLGDVERKGNLDYLKQVHDAIIDMSDLQNPISDIGQTLDNITDGADDASEQIKTFVKQLEESGTNGANALGQVNDQIQNVKQSSTALSLVMRQVGAVALNVLASAAISAAISGIIVVIQKLISSYDDLIEKVQGYTQEYKNSNKELSDYSNEISELHKVMNSSTSTTEEVTQATSRLYEIQNSLIGTYGSYASGIDLVNGKLETQLEILNNIDKRNLSDWHDKVSNEKSFGAQFKTGTINALAFLGSNIKYNAIPGANVLNPEIGKLGLAVKNNGFKNGLEDYFLDTNYATGKKTETAFDEIKEDIEEFNATIKATDNAKINQIIDSYRSLTVSNGNISISGDVRQVQDDLYNLREYLKTIGYENENLFDDIGKHSNEARERVEASFESYNTETLFQIYDDDKLAKYYNELSVLHNNYIKALATTDSEQIEKATSEYSNALGNILKDTKIEDRYKDYYKTMFDDIGNLVSKTDFEVNVLPVLNRNKNIDLKKYLDYTSIEDITTDLALYNSDIANQTSILTKTETEQFNNLAEAAHEAGYEIEEVITAYKNYNTESPSNDSFYNLSVVPSSFEAITTALSEQSSQGYLTKETLEQLNNTYGEMEDNLYEFTENGIMVNTDALFKYNDALNEVAMTSAKLKEADAVRKYQKEAESLRKLVSSNDDLKQAYDNGRTSLQNYLATATDLDENTKNSIRLRMQTLQDLANEINKYDMLEAEIRATTSTLNEYNQATQTANLKDNYDTAKSMVSSLKDSLEKGWIGTDDFRKGMEYIAGYTFDADISEYGSSAYDSAWQTKYNEFIERAERYFTDDISGIYNFLDDAIEKTDHKMVDYVDDAYVFKIDSVDEFAQKMDMSVSAAMDMLLATNEAWDFNLDISSLESGIADGLTAIENGSADARTNLDELDKQITIMEEHGIKGSKELREYWLDLSDKFSPSVKSINTDVLNTSAEDLSRQTETIISEVGGKFEGMDIEINVDADIDTLDETIDALQTVRSNASIDGEFDADEYENATIVLQDLLNKKHELESQNIMSIDMTGMTAEETGAYSTIQSYVGAYQDLENKVTIGVDDSQIKEAEARVNTLQERLNNLDTATLGNIKLPDISMDMDPSELYEKLINIDVNDKVGENTVKIEANDSPARKTLNDLMSTVNSSHGDIEIGAKLEDGFINNTQSLLDTHTYTLKVKTQTPNVSTILSGDAGAEGGKITHASANNLVGELGQELLVRDGRYYTVGDNGAEMVPLRQGDIIFNAEQTAELLRNGQIKSRGKLVGNSFASGNAYDDGANVYGEGTDDKGGTKWDNTAKNIEKAADNIEKASEKNEESSKKIKDVSKDTAEVFDWIQVKLQRLEEAVQRIDKVVTNIFETWEKRSKSLNDEIETLTKQIKAEEKAQKRYEYWAGKVKIQNKPKKKDYGTGDDFNKAQYNYDKKQYESAKEIWKSGKYQKLVQNGKIGGKDIEKIKNKYLVEAIKEYQELWEKGIEAGDTAQDKRIERLEKENLKLDNIIEQWEEIIKLTEQSAEILDEYVNRTESLGFFVNTEDMKKQAELIKKQRDQTEEQLIAAKDQFNDLVKRGILIEGTQAYSEAQEKLFNIFKKHSELNTQYMEQEKKIREYTWEKFDYLQERLDAIVKESEYVQKLLQSEKMMDDAGNLNNRGYANMAMIGVQYDEALRKMADYKKEIEDFKKVMDWNNKDDVKHLQDLEDGFYGAADSMEAAKDSAKSFYEEIINAHLSKLKELMDEYKQTLSAAKDLYDFQKNIGNQTKNIENLRKQLTAYQGDNSEAGRKRRQELTNQLNAAEQQLQETEWDRYISQTNEMLDNLYSDYEENLNARLDNIDGLVQELVRKANDNKDAVKNGLIEIRDKYGAIYDNFESFTKDQNTDLLAGLEDGTLGKGVTTISTVVTTIEDVVKKMFDNSEAMKKVLADEFDYIINDDGTVTIKLKDDARATSEEIAKAAGISVSAYEDAQKKVAEERGTKLINVTTIDSAPNTSNGIFVDSAEIEKQKKEAEKKAIQEQIDEINARLEGFKKIKNPSSSMKKTMSDLETERKRLEAKLAAYAIGTSRVPSNQLAWTQEKGSELIFRRSDGAMLTPLGSGDMVFTHSMSQRLWELAQELDHARFNMLSANLPDIKSNLTTTINQNNQIEITLPNVNDYASFKYELQNDLKFEKFIQEITLGQAMGNNTLNKRKY